MNHERVKEVDGVHMIGLFDGLDDLKDVKSLIGYVVHLGEGLFCDVMNHLPLSQDKNYTSKQ